MSWDDRDYAGDDPGKIGRPGGDWQGVRPTLDNPMSWSLPLGRAMGIAVRLHIVFIVYVVIELLRSVVQPAADGSTALGWEIVVLRLVCLFTIVLLHEFGHCLACRRMRGDANEILMWPLGGLAFCRPPQHWKAHLVTAIGGPLVNVAIFVVLAPTLYFMHGTFWGVAIPNPLGYLPFGGRESWLIVTLYNVHQLSFLLLLFNLLPIFPLDGGRIAQALLWPSAGYVRSMRVAVYMGYVGALVIGIAGIVFSQWMLLFIAVFGGITCYVTIKQLQWTEAVMGGDDLYAASTWVPGDLDDEDPGASRGREKVDRKARKKTERAEAVAADEAAEVDRILAKIGAEGMDSLNTREARVLKEATERRRKNEGD